MIIRHGIELSSDEIIRIVQERTTLSAIQWKSDSTGFRLVGPDNVWISAQDVTNTVGTHLGAELAFDTVNAENTPPTVLFSVKGREEAEPVQGQLQMLHLGAGDGAAQENSPIRFAKVLDTFVTDIGGKKTNDRFVRLKSPSAMADYGVCITFYESRYIGIHVSYERKKYKETHKKFCRFLLTHPVWMWELKPGNCPPGQPHRDDASRVDVGIETPLSKHL